MSTATTKTTHHVPVIIIGGGIVGLSAALCLAHHSISTLLIERHSSTSIHPRARSVNARSMEIYRSLGIDTLVRDAGAHLSPSMGIYTGPSLSSVIGPKKRKDGVRKIPGAGLFESVSCVTGAWATQDYVEPVLLTAARERGVDVRLNTECLNIEQDSDGVVVILRDRGHKSESGSRGQSDSEEKEGEKEGAYTVRADYLIAADGANSPIRNRLGVKTTGRGTMGHLLNILFTADLKEFVQGREFSLCIIDREDKKVGGLFTSINNADKWVFHLSYNPEKGEKAQDFTPEKCKQLLHTALGMEDIEITIQSILPWEPSVRVAEQLQHGRIFLAGDAAHQMPPWAGQGANSGIADIHNLAWKLAAVIKHHAGTELLKTYDVERLPVGRVAAEISASAADDRGIIEMKKSLTTVKSVYRRAGIVSGHGYTYTSNAIVQENTGPLGGVTWKAWSVASLALGLDGKPGSRAPHVWVDKQGQRISTLDLFGRHFVLLAGSDGQAWCDAAKGCSSALNMEIQSYTVGPRGNLVDEKYYWQGAAGISSQGALLVRPDGFVVWRERRSIPDPQQQLETVMRQVLAL